MNTANLEHDGKLGHKPKNKHGNWFGPDPEIFDRNLNRNCSYRVL